MAWIMMMDVARCSLFGGWRHGREQLDWSSAGRPPKGSLHVTLFQHLNINMHPFEHSDVMIK